MNISRSAQLGVALSIGALSLAAAARTAGAQRSRFRSDDRSSLDTTVTLDKNGTVNLTATEGNITVTGASANQVRVHATSDDNNLRFDASASEVTLSIRGGSDSRFEITVPYGARVVAHTRSGDISIRGTRGAVEARTASGDVRVEDVTSRLDVNTFSGDVGAESITGDVEMSTISGDVKIDDLKGNVDIQTVSGDIGLRAVTAKLVRAKTTSGDVVYDGTIDPAGRYELSSNSGDIGLHVPRDANAQVTVSTWNGTIDSQFPITLTPGEHGIGTATAKRFTFQVGAGAARITAETFSGDVTISQNGHGASERR
ncbi:MAG: DUF4097 family beta strand repeat-containing protein [Gemmatimonadales bacterium]